MSIQEMKEKLLNDIGAIEDERMLQQVYDVLHPRRGLVVEERNAAAYQLSDGQRAAVRNGLEDIAQGRIMSDNEAEAELDKWFDEEDKKWGEK